MKARKVLFIVLTIAASHFTASGNPVNPLRPVASETVPFPDEIKEAIASRSVSEAGGWAELSFHIDKTGHVVLDEVNAETVALCYHIWKTVHGMETHDSTLVEGRSYSLDLVIR